MKKLIYFFLLLISTELACQVKGQRNNELTIPLTNLAVYPENIAQPGSGIEKITDGKCDNDQEIFHTLWQGITKQDITIEADLEGDQKRLDKVILIPRSFGYNGIIKKAELWIMANSKYLHVASIEGYLSGAPIQIELEKPIQQPEKIKLVITDSYADLNSDLYMVSLGELKCVMLPDDAITRVKLLNDSDVFSGLTGVSLKPDIGIKDIEKMMVPPLKQLATDLFENKYKPGSLLVNIDPYLDPVLLGKQKRIGSGFSKYEGITGIVLNKGEHIVFVGKTNGVSIKLLVPDWSRKPPKGIKPEKDPLGWGLKSQEFILQEGVNLVYLEKGGNAYIQYFVDQNPDVFPSVAVHFPTGTYNGYFDITRGDTDQDFDKLLDNSISPVVDLKGKYIQAAYPVISLKEFTRGRGVELVENYDTIIGMQRYLTGWEKEGFRPKNHILARVNYQYYMFRDQDGVAFIDWAMPLVTKPESVIAGDPCWGFCHEVGHVLQMTPQMTWGGMTEVSNNIYTMYCHTTLGNQSRLVQENWYAAARETILDKNISFMDFPGKADPATTNPNGGTGNTDMFQRLIPFWQLYLYFKEQSYPDFYPDLMIAMRKQEPLGNGDKNKDYLNMLEFCRLACEVSKTDLTDFFERWGFFYVGEVDVYDYNTCFYTISQQDIDDVKRKIAAMNLPKPIKDLTLMTD